MCMLARTQSSMLLFPTPPIFYCAVLSEKVLNHRVQCSFFFSFHVTLFIRMKLDAALAVVSGVFWADL